MADDKHFGLLYLHKDILGIWHKGKPSIIIDKNPSVRNESSLYFEHTMLPESVSNIDSFSVGIIDKNQAQKIYSLKQQQGCTFSINLYQLSDNKYLVLFHLTAGKTENINKANEYLQRTVNFSNLWARIHISLDIITIRRIFPRTAAFSPANSIEGGLTPIRPPSYILNFIPAVLLHFLPRKHLPCSSLSNTRCHIRFVFLRQIRQKTRSACQSVLIFYITSYFYWYYCGFLLKQKKIPVRHLMWLCLIALCLHQWKARQKAGFFFAYAASRLY